MNLLPRVVGRQCIIHQRLKTNTLAARPSVTPLVPNPVRFALVWSSTMSVPSAAPAASSLSAASAPAAPATSPHAAASVPSTSVAQGDGWVNDVLDYWFKHCGVNEWFVHGHTIDTIVTSRFSALYDEIVANVPPAAYTDPKVALATVIVLDQFPRNMFRGTARAFATDALALKVARNAVARGLDKGLGLFEATFLYLPFQHSEDLADQEEGIRLSEAIGASEQFMSFAYAHRDIIKRFGRFPYRNAVLGRTCTPEEIEFNTSHDGFGQTARREQGEK